MEKRDPCFSQHQPRSRISVPDLLTAFQEGRIESCLAQSKLTPYEKSYLSRIQAASWVDFFVKAFRVLKG
jgi:hypothetical protein